MHDTILATINNYYTEKIRKYGATPMGVDWNSRESQELRFTQLCKLIEFHTDFSLLDFGCGYGALFNHIQKNYTNCSYSGFDISKEMISHAIDNFKDFKNAQWLSNLPDGAEFDFVIASGIFNVRLDTSYAHWTKYVEDTLNVINKMSTKGFSFNMLTSYSDEDYMKDYLYYADPRNFFDYCKRKFYRSVALLHDYPLYEFTIIVKKREA